MADFGFGSDPFKVSNDGGSNGTRSTADSSRSGGSRRGGGLSRNKSSSGGFEPGFEDPSFAGRGGGGAGGGGLAPAPHRPSQARSRRRASMAAPAQFDNGGGGGGFGNFEAPSFDAPAPAPTTRKPARSRRASMVGAGSSRSMDGSIDRLNKANSAARTRSGASGASVGSNGSGGPGSAGAPTRPRRSRRASMAGAPPEMPARDMHRSAQTEQPEYGYGGGGGVTEQTEYGYGASSNEQTDYGYGNDSGAPTAPPASPAPRKSRRESCTGMMQREGSQRRLGTSDPFADLKSGGGFNDNKMAAPAVGGPSIGNTRQNMNIMLPMAKAAAPEKPKEGGGRSRRRASMLGMVGSIAGGVAGGVGSIGNLAGVGGGGKSDNMQSLGDGEAKKSSGKKGFFKDRKADKSKGAVDTAAKSGPSKDRADRRRQGGGGGLLDRLDAAPSSRGGGRAQGAKSYSGRIVMGN